MSDFKASDFETSDFATKGWTLFPPEPKLRRWAEFAAPLARKRAADQSLHPQWLRAQGTWFVGADVLGNDRAGRLAGGPELAGDAVEFARAHLGGQLADWGPGQVSVCYPGYPQQADGESDAAFRFRRERDAAHLDGLKPVGTPVRRFFEEYHGFILGIPLNAVPEGASPFVIWEGSHRIIRDWLVSEFKAVPEEDWHKLDLTEAYKAKRREVFETCPRIEVTAPVGGAYLAHHLSIHGMAPWRAGPHEGRYVSYFRPFWKGSRKAWLAL